jgi:hypothetical protein
MQLLRFLTTVALWVINSNTVLAQKTHTIFFWNMGQPDSKKFEKRLQILRMASQYINPISNVLYSSLYLQVFFLKFIRVEVYQLILRNTINNIRNQHETKAHLANAKLVNEVWKMTPRPFSGSTKVIIKINTSFKDIRILLLPIAKTLKHSGSTAITIQAISNPSLLSDTASNPNTSFQYAIIAASVHMSDAFYTENFTIKNPNATRIKVQFKSPTDWGTAGIFIWAWNEGANLFNTSPGVAMTYEGNGWFSYYFAETASTINVIFSKSGGPQTIDITNITTSSCFESSGMSGNKLNVALSQNCNTTSTNNTKTQFSMCIYPQPVSDKVMLELPHTGHRGTTTLEILSLDGRQLITKSFDTQAILVDTQTLLPGVYVMRMYDAQRKLLYSDKLMIR